MVPFQTFYDKNVFLSSCVKTEAGDFLFEFPNETGEVKGLYKDITSYISRLDALALIAERPSWVSSFPPNGLPSDRIGSYCFLIDFSHNNDQNYKRKTDITNDFLKPWSTTRDNKQRITPKWEKFPTTHDRCVRVSKSRHPKFPWLKRLMVFESDAVDGTPVSLVFYQYVIENKEYIRTFNEVTSVSLDSLNYPSIPSSSQRTGEIGGMDVIDPYETSSICRGNQPNFNRSLLPIDPFSEALLQLQETYQTIQESLAQNKRLYMETNDVNKMRAVSTKCEQLALLEKETRETVNEMLKRTTSKMVEICGEIEPPEKMIRTIKEEFRSEELLERRE